MFLDNIGFLLAFYSLNRYNKNKCTQYARKVVIKMEEQRSPSNRPVNPRRRKRTKMQIFKEAYLPVIIAGLALVLILVFIIGSVSRAIQRKNDQKADKPPLFRP